MSALTDVQCEQPLVKPPPPQRGSAERRACVSLVAGGFLLLAGATLALLLVRTQREVNITTITLLPAASSLLVSSFGGPRPPKNRAVYYIHLSVITSSILIVISELGPWEKVDIFTRSRPQWCPGGSGLEPATCSLVCRDCGTKLPGNSPLPWNVLPSSEWSHDMYNKSECAVIIPVSGLYAINLQITYRSTPHLDHPDSFIVLKNEVKKQLVRYQPGRNVTILTAMDTVPNTDVWMKTIHSQITLFLGEGDKLQVVVSHPNLVDLGGQAQTKSFWELAFLYA
uniref:THD domain-containing protein n=1 Tax=Denticeps clupeoides TaxID=299321 RepID=A0AAY4BJG8_9TELE